MALRSRLLCLVSLIAGCGGSPSKPGLAITGATVISVLDGSRIENAAIMINDGRITAIGPAGDVTVPMGARVVEARGKYVIPGLWEMHTHIMNPREAEVFFPLLVAHGVVGIRDAGGDVGGDEGMTPAQFRELAARAPYAPRTFACGASIDGPALARLGADAILDQQAPQGVTCIKLMSLIPRDGFLKIIAGARERGLPVAGHVPVTVSAAEASDFGLQTIEHLTEILIATSDKEAELRRERIAATMRPLPVPDFELAVYSPPTEPLFSTWSDAKAAALFRKFIANHTWQTPTLMTYAVRRPGLSGDSAFWHDPSLALVPKPWVDSWRPEHNKWLAGVAPARVPVITGRMEAWHRGQLELVRRMHAAGVGFLAGTDVSNWNMHVPGVSLHQELEQFVEAGLSPLEALQTATINPARHLGITDSVGTIAAGKVADLLILDADPTENISNTRRIAAVVLGGRLIDRGELDRVLDGARTRAAAYPRP